MTLTADQVRLRLDQADACLARVEDIRAQEALAILIGILEDVLPELVENDEAERWNRPREALP